MRCEKTYTCSFCNERFSDEKAVKSHERCCYRNPKGLNCFRCAKMTRQAITVESNIGLVIVGSRYVCQKYPNGNFKEGARNDWAAIAPGAVWCVEDGNGIFGYGNGEGARICEFFEREGQK